MATYQITTDKGTYEIETGEAQPQDQSLYGKLSSFQKVPAPVQNVAEQINVPGRIGRGIGVGLGDASRSTGIEPMNAFPQSPVSAQQIPRIVNAAKDPLQTLRNLKDSLVRGAQGMRPGFQPTPQETPFANVGEGVGNAAAAIPLGGTSIPATAAAMGGLTALQQASQGQVKLAPSIPKSPIDLIPDSVIGNTIFSGMAAAAPDMIQAFRQSVKNTALKVLPRTFAKTASIPEQATSMAIQNPRLTKSIGDLESNIQDQAQKVMGALKQAKTQIGEAHGAAYLRYAGLENPIDNFIEGNQVQKPIFGSHAYQTSDVQLPKPGSLIGSPTETTGTASNTSVIGTQGRVPPAKSIDDVRAMYKQAQSGDLLKTIDSSTGGIKDLPDKDKLAVLSELKRDIQSHINFNKHPITLAPVDTVQDAALKKMASQVDALRDTLPNGKKLSTVDRGWQAIHDIYGQLQRDLSTPGKAEDTLMKLFKRDPSAITSGRTAEKIAAIRRVESITGQKVLKPLFEQFTQREFGKAVGKGLSHTLLTGGGLGGAATALATGHPLGAAALALGTLPGSPMAIGAGIRSSQAIGEGLQSVANNPGARSALLAALLSKKKDQNK